jgi:hypothetical protein
MLALSVYCAVPSASTSGASSIGWVRAGRALPQCIAVVSIAFVFWCRSDPGSGSGIPLSTSIWTASLSRSSCSLSLGFGCALHWIHVYRHAPIAAAAQLARSRRSRTIERLQSSAPCTRRRAPPRVGPEHRAVSRRSRVAAEDVAPVLVAHRDLVPATDD